MNVKRIRKRKLKLSTNFCIGLQGCRRESTKICIATVLESESLQYWKMIVEGKRKWKLKELKNFCIDMQLCRKESNKDLHCNSYDSKLQIFKTLIDPPPSLQSRSRQRNCCYYTNYRDLPSCNTSGSQARETYVLLSRPQSCPGHHNSQHRYS